MTHVLITRFLYDVLISRVLISRVDCIISKAASQVQFQVMALYALGIQLRYMDAGL